MIFKYKCNQDIIDVWVDKGCFIDKTLDLYDKVEVVIHSSGVVKEHIRKLRMGDGGKFFTWNKEKIYLDDWIKPTYEELTNSIHNNCITKEILCQYIFANGFDSLKLKICDNMNEFLFKQDPEKATFSDGHFEKYQDFDIISQYKIDIVYDNGIRGRDHSYLDSVIYDLNIGYVKLENNMQIEKIECAG